MRTPKERHYPSTKGQFFCPSCHREISMPFKNINVVGSIRLGCGCKNGVVVIKGSKPPEPEKPNETV